MSTRRFPRRFKAVRRRVQRRLRLGLDRLAARLSPDDEPPTDGRATPRTPVFEPPYLA